MKLCPDCLHANDDAAWPGYTDGCEPCNVRGLAGERKFIQERYLAMTLEKGGQKAVDELKAKLDAERGRVRRLKARAE